MQESALNNSSIRACIYAHSLFNSYSFVFQVARMIIVVAVAFIVAWSPFYWVTFISQVQKKSFLRMANHVFVMLAVHLVGFINSCINPFIYTFMSDKFRKSFAQILISMCCLCAPTRLRKLFTTSHGRSYRNSEYDGDYSVGDYIKGNDNTRSPISGGRKDRSGRKGSKPCREATTIIRLSSLNTNKDSQSSSTQGFQQVSPDHYATHLTNGTTLGHAGDGSGKARDLMSGSVSCLSDDLRKEEKLAVSVRGDKINIEIPLSGDTALDHDMDLFVDSSTSRLLRNEATTSAN